MIRFDLVHVHMWTPVASICFHIERIDDGDASDDSDNDYENNNN